MRVPFLLGRILFGGFFLYHGINHFRNRKALAQYAGAKNVPMPDAAVIASGALLALGGASVLTGVRPRCGTTAIAAFLAGATPIMHDFWRMKDNGRRNAEMAQFMKNFALLGGSLALMSVDEPWEASFPVAQPGPVERMRSARRLLAA